MTAPPAPSEVIWGYLALFAADPVGGPEAVAARVYPLGVDVPLAAGAVVLPGDDGPAGAIRGYLGMVNIIRRCGAHPHPVGGPERDAAGVYTLGVDVRLAAGAVVLPDDDRPAGAV